MRIAWAGPHNLCWIFSIGALLIGMIVFFAWTSFPTSRNHVATVGGSSMWELTGRNITIDKLVQSSITLTQEIWIGMAAVLILMCLGLVTIMLCGTSVENIARLLSVLAFLFMIGVSLLFYFRPDLLEKVILFIKDKGVWGNFLMGFSFLVVSFPLTIGCVVLALCCGFIYGLFIGSITACLGLFLGGLLAYYVCYKLLKKPVLKIARSTPKLVAILIALRDNAWYVSIALRISPVPLGLQNGLLAITVPMRVYLGSLPFAFPEQILFAYFGREAEQLMDVLSGKSSLQTGQIWLMVFDVVVGILLVVACGYFGKKIMQKATAGVERLEEFEDSASSSEDEHVV